MNQAKVKWRVKGSQVKVGRERDGDSRDAMVGQQAVWVRGITVYCVYVCNYVYIVYIVYVYGISVYSCRSLSTRISILLLLLITHLIHPIFSRHQRQTINTTLLSELVTITKWLTGLHHSWAPSGDDWYTATILVSPLIPITLLAYYLWG